MAKEITVILNDDRVLSYEDIIKKNSTLLPPIHIIQSTKRVKNPIGL
jgi:hypothetical protein